MVKKKATKGKSKTKKKSDVVDRRVGHFGEEVGKLGEKFGKRMEKRGREWDSWFHRTLGLVGPLLSAVFGIIIFSIFTWFIHFVNTWVESVFLTNIYSFLVANISLFFLIFLFFSYTSYFSKASPRTYRAFSPVSTAMGITIAFWIFSEVIVIANFSLAVPALWTIAYHVSSNLIWIFWFFLFVGYLVLAVKLAKKPIHEELRSLGEEVAMGRTSGKPRKGEVRRLYRSGKDRILGGVCGGIAEYLGVDPVIIRLLWIVGTLAWGFGIILYIICWIIIPRNPRHRWN